MSGMALLPQKLSSSDKWSWMFEFPPNNVGPLVKAQREISVRMNPF